MISVSSDMLENYAEKQREMDEKEQQIMPAESGGHQG